MTLSATKFWKNVKKALANKGMKQIELCKECGFNKNSFNNRIHNETFPTIDEVFLISKTLDISIDKLVGLQTTHLSQNAVDIAEKIDALPQKYQRIISDIVDCIANGI